MSLKSMLMPAISQRLLSQERLLRQRAGAERLRLSIGERHQVHYFHQVDDPYSALTADSLEVLLARYDIKLTPHVVGAPSDAAAPERDKLVSYSRRDAQLLAHRFGMNFRDPGVQPSKSAVAHANGLLVAAIEHGDFVKLAEVVSTQLWKDAASLREGAAMMPSRATMMQGSAEPEEVARHLSLSNGLRRKLGHYLGATFFYAGEWYWGIDRLHHLERRLQELGARRQSGTSPMFPAATDLRLPLHLLKPAPIDFFFSLRSPYSAIVAPRVFALGQLAGTSVKLRFVLPMVMRGLPVPRDKRRYISLDTAREARMRGIPFGRLNDPVGRPTERGLALIPWAESAGKGSDYVLSFMQGVWAEGLDAGSARGLRKIVERVGLPWSEACLALKEEGWRKTAEDNRAELSSLGLWGVPSFRVNDTSTWGQDRLWAVEDALLGTHENPR